MTIDTPTTPASSSPAPGATCQACGEPWPCTVAGNLKAYRADVSARHQRRQLPAAADVDVSSSRPPRRRSPAAAPAAKPLDWRPEYERIKAAYVDELWRRLMRGEYAGRRVYAFFTPSSGDAWGTFFTLTDDQPTPAGAAPVAGEPVPMNSRAQLAAWLDARAAGLPVLPTAGPYAHVKGAR
jgi:hypothetical protein